MPEYPKLLELIDKISRLKARLGLTYEYITNEFNKNLPVSRQLRPPNGQLQVERWLSPLRQSWCEPRGEIVLAMIEVLARLQSLANEKQVSNRRRNQSK